VTEKMTLLGMTIEREPNNGAITIRQGPAIERLAAKLGITGNEPETLTPVPMGTFPPKDAADDLDDKEKKVYSKVVGEMIYVLITRPDIAYAVSLLTRRLTTPTLHHARLLKRVVTYLAQTKDLGLRFEADIPIELEGWADAAFKDDVATRRSTGGLIVKLKGSAAILTKAKLQQIIALSTCEAEMIQLSICGQFIVWARNLLKELGWEQKEPTVIHEDNMATANLAKHGRLSEKSIHMDHKDLWTVDQVKNKKIRIKYCPTQAMIADILTKPLPPGQFMRLRALLLNTDGAAAINEGLC